MSKEAKIVIKTELYKDPLEWPICLHSKNVRSYFSDMYGFAVTFSVLDVTPNESWNLVVSRFKINLSITATCKSKRIYEKPDYRFSKNAIANIVYFDL